MSDETKAKGKAKKEKGKGKKIMTMLLPGLLMVGVAKMTVLKAPVKPPCPVEIVNAEPLKTAAATTDAIGRVAATTTTSTTTTTTTTNAACVPVAEGAALVLDPITLNMADGRFLKLGIALQLSASADPTVMDKDGAGAKALDAAIAMFGSKSYDDLIDVDARDAIRYDLAKRLVGEFDGKVMGVYFTEFVMQ